MHFGTKYAFRLLLIESIYAWRGGAMTENMALRVEGETGADQSAIIERGPDSYVDLEYGAHQNPDYIRVSARNHHPEKAIYASFYIMREKGGIFVPSKLSEKTIKACLKPFQSTVIHFDEKKHNPRLFLFNATFDGDD
jgi:hypothetical protein